MINYTNQHNKCNVITQIIKVSEISQPFLSKMFYNLFYSLFTLFSSLLCRQAHTRAHALSLPARWCSGGGGGLRFLRTWTRSSRQVHHCSPETEECDQRREEQGRSREEKSRRKAGEEQEKSRGGEKQHRSENKKDIRQVKKSSTIEKIRND